MRTTGPTSSTTPSRSCGDWSRVADLTEPDPDMADPDTSDPISLPKVVVVTGTSTDVG